MEHVMRKEFPSAGFKGGYLSFWDGRREPENPYRSGTDLCAQWADGNKAAATEHAEIYGIE